jgi:L-2-hydroxyglutarate oxidase LhgO
VERHDFLVIGGGVIGVTVALALARRQPGARVCLIEKEAGLARHASGRNSGVLHAGFYYAADSLKARFTREGNRRLTEYCLERGLKLRRSGKLVVTRSEEELGGLAELLRRGRRNGIELDELDERQAREIEPKVKTFARALFSPTTAVVDPVEVVASLARDAMDLGVDCRAGVRYLGRRDGRVLTSAGPIEAGYVVNAAGLYADQVARDFGFSRRYRILPFKGLYLYVDLPPGAVRTNIYPVPDLRNPFLGVHLTVTVDGHVKIGPTAMPALWRENYGGLENFDARELAEVAFSEAMLLLHAGFDFKRLAMSEAAKRLRPVLVRQASALLKGLRLSDCKRWGRPGIRAQLYDVQEKTLVMDFLLEGDARSLHVLNAVSPAFTASLPFADFIIGEAERLAG